MDKFSITPVAESIPFDNSSNGFTATDTQHAIEETKLLISGYPRWTLTLIYNGVVSNGTWMGYSYLIPGDVSPIVIGLKSYLNEFTFTNRVLSADFDLEFYKNGQTVTEKFLTVTKTASHYFVYPSSGTIDQLFEQGDRLYIKYVDTGTNSQDVCIVLYFTVYIP